jgi:tetratricopeptide (TPR) repeat protein
MFPPPRRRRYRGWLSPLYNLIDSIQEMWWNIRRFFARLFDFRWLTRSTAGIVEYIWWGMKYPFQVIGWLLQQAWAVLVAWWQIRNFRYLIQGLPALIGIIFILVITAYTLMRSDDGLQELYIRQSNDALMHADRQRAQLCLERLMQLQYAGDPRRQETQFKLARLAFEMGQYQRSRSLFTNLANPDNDDGLADAHLERAREINLRSKRTKEDLDLMEKHLRRAIKKQPDHKAVNALLGILLAERGRPDEAIQFLQKSDPTDVQARLVLGRIYRQQGNQVQANLYIEPVIDYLRSMAGGEIDDIRYRTTLAQALMQVDEFEQAVQVLETAYSMKKSDFFRIVLSNCYIEWFRKLTTMRQTPERERQKLDCLVKALEWDNTNAQAMNLFVHYMNTTGNDAQERDNAHRLLMALRGNNAYLHLWMGEKLLSEQRVEEARKEWDTAYKLNPDSSIIANNFAWILTHGSKSPLPLAPDLLKAERIINEVLARTRPDDRNKPYYHGTRGVIYMKMGRYQDARDELVLATQRPGAENDFNLQQQLVEVYERLGMRTMADNHRKLIQEIIRRNRTETGPQ